MPYLGNYGDGDITETDPTVTSVGKAVPLLLQLDGDGKLSYNLTNANLYSAFAQFDEGVDAQSSIQREDRDNTDAIKMKADAGDAAANKYVSFFYYLKPS